MISQLRRARVAAFAAALCLALLVVVWWAAHDLAAVRHADVSILAGFVELHRPGLDRITNAIATLCDPHTYVWLAAIPVLVALLRRRPRVAVTVALVILGANATTQLLKPLLAGPRDLVWFAPIGTASWPSGHATAAMSLALCAVIAAPARRRPMVAVAMGCFAVAVCYSFLELAWHYPSDVFGGFLVAAGWTLVGVAGLSLYEAARPPRRRGDAPDRAALSLREALGPPAVVIACAAMVTALLLIARPQEVIAYARVHETFVIGAAAIAAFGLTLASSLMLMLRR